MKKLICIAVLALAVSTPALAEPNPYCKVMGKIAQGYLKEAKAGINPYAQIVNNPEGIMAVGMEESIPYLIISKDMWDNREIYTPAKAYKTGYRLCMELK